ncbi:MAG: hypothetical protein U0641_05810 [Anaerolineae bacterium]
MAQIEFRWVNSRIVVQVEEVNGKKVFSAWEKVFGEDWNSHDIFSFIGGERFGDVASRATVEDAGMDIQKWEVCEEMMVSNRNEAWAFIHEAFPEIKKCKTWKPMANGDIVMWNS